MDKEALSNGRLGNANTHVNLFYSFQSHQVFSSLFGFPLFSGSLGFRHRSRCFSNLRIQ
jgi:hypothetical protein